MSLFCCIRCGCVENTSNCRYWASAFDTDNLTKLPRFICSECDPLLGKWQGRFAKEDAGGMWVSSDGFIHHPESVTDKGIVDVRIIGSIPELPSGS